MGFLIYSNDLPSTLHSSQVTMYADDTTLSHSTENVVDLSENFNRELCSLIQWFQGFL